jgi:hypothetical protein
MHANRMVNIWKLFRDLLHRFEVRVFCGNGDERFYAIDHGLLDQLSGALAPVVFVI